MKQRRYQNIDKNARPNTLGDTIRWQFERRKHRFDLSFKIPSVGHTEREFLQTNRTLPTITWIGHSTFLIQLDGLNIVTDPVWAKRLGTFKRLTAPGLPISELPVIDLVLTSHSHYDHLHYGSIKKLPGNPTFLVPIGLARAFKRRGLKNVIEYSWWDKQKIKGLQISFVPAQHWTKRTLTDTNRSHWGGWVIESPKQTVYFAGDSGYFEEFKDIGEKFKIDYALMPIGAYDPAWFLASQHLNPEEAIQAFLDVEAKTMIPMHYGAYMLADETPKEALDRLTSAWEDKQFTDKHLNVLKLGETLRME